MSVSWGQQPKQKSLQLPLSTHLLQLIGEKTRAFPGQLREVISPESATWLCLEILSRKTRNRIVTNGSPVRVQHLLGTSLTYCQQCGPSSCKSCTRTEWLIQKHPPTTHSEARGWKPCTSPQNTCRLVRKNPTHPQIFLRRYRVHPVFHEQDKTEL